MNRLHIRHAEARDAEAVQAIYAPCVECTAISFETEAPSAQEMEARIAAASRAHAWLVAERGGELAGYAYGTEHRSRPAYRFSVEVSVYVHAGHRNAGVGAMLYQHLFEELARRGYFNAYAGITLPNEPSVRLHGRLGFVHVGTFPRAGHKFGAWHDVSWWHLALRDGLPGEE